MSKPKMLKIFDNNTDDVAYSKFNNPVTVTQSGNTLIVPTTIKNDGDVMLTFRSPCDSTAVTSIIVNSISYNFADSLGSNISSCPHVFSTGSYVTVVLDTTNNLAYVQNSANNPTINNLYSGKSTIVNATLSATSWTVENQVTSYTYTNSNIKSSNTVIELLPGDNITVEQYDALQYASIVGGIQSAGSIQLIVLGETPQIDIPVKFIFRGDM